MCQRVPVPELAEHHHSNNSAGVLRPCATLKADSDIPSTGIDEALAQCSTKASHGVFVLVSDDLRVQCACRRHGRGRGLRLLDKDHSEGDEGTLSDEIDAVLGHRLEDIHSILKTCTCASDTQSERGTTSYVRVVTFAQELDDARNLCRILEQEEGQGCDCRTPDIIRRVGNSDVQEFADSVVIRCSGIRESQGVDATIPQDGILLGQSVTLSFSASNECAHLLSQKLFGDLVGLFLTAVV